MKRNSYSQMLTDILRVIHSSTYVVAHSLASTRHHTINRVSRGLRENQNITQLGRQVDLTHAAGVLGNTIAHFVSSAVQSQLPSQQSSPSHEYAGSDNNKYTTQQIDIQDDDTGTNTFTPPSRLHSGRPVTHNTDASYNIPISSDITTAVSSNINSVRQAGQRIVNTARVAGRAAKTAVEEEIARDPTKPKQPTDVMIQTLDAIPRSQASNSTSQQPQHHQQAAPSITPPVQTPPPQPTSSQHTVQQQPQSKIQLHSTQNHAPPQPSIPGAQPTNLAQAANISQRKQEQKQQQANAAQTTPQWQPRETAVPSSQFGRVWGFGKLAAGMAFGSVTDRLGMSGSSTPASTQSGRNDGSTISSAFSGGNQAQSSSGLSTILSESNAERLAEGLCRMRGAALKVGQILSIQDESVLPPQLQAIFDRVRDRADVMPQRQLQHALTSELGSDWQTKLQAFDTRPIAAASIGQVHKATLHDGRDVVMKVQYPGVADSINSDINNVKRMVTWLNIVPKGLYLDETMGAAKEELGLECDYEFEAKCQHKYKQLMQPFKPVFYVPDVIDELSTKRVLTTELVAGVSIDKLAIGSTSEQSQQTRDRVASELINLCITELFTFRFMQTDPNWSNFLYDPQSDTINLIDFGACRTYNKLFVDEYMRMVHACATRNREECIDASIRMGFLTGDESKTMLNAHVEAGFIIGEPFASTMPYDFVAANIPQRVAKLAAVMLQHRLTPPPKEAYTLHRKLSGAFLTARKLSAKISCHDQFFNLYKNYQFDDDRYDAKKAKQAKVAHAVVV